MTLRARMTTATAVATCLFVASACQAPTEITLEIATDVPCAETRGTAITVGRIGDLDEKRLPTVQTLKCDEGGRIGTLVIAPSGESDDVVSFAVTTSIGVDIEACTTPRIPKEPRPATGCIVARRSLRYSRHTNLHVYVPMRRACDGVYCAPDQTCVNKACVPATLEVTAACTTARGCGEEALAPAR